MRTASALAIGVWLAAIGAAFPPALAQDGNFTAADVSAGHDLAIKVCAVCHLAAPDQRAQPMLKPPAPPFAQIMQGRDITAGSLRTFLMTTHRGLDQPNGMPNPSLADFQVKQAIAYLMSLRK
jgi:mono/diheme cytochrome c family protein